MSSSYKVLENQDLEDFNEEIQAFALDVLIGLSEMPKRLSSKYFYDARGSQLFEEIMELPEYYPTQCEFNIFRQHKNKIADLVDSHSFNLVELGAGNGRKTKVLISHFLEHDLEFRYVPIDISEAAMNALVKSLEQEFSILDTRGIVAEYFKGLKWLNNFTDRLNLVLFLGSNLGNFNKPQARVFLRNLWNTLNDGDFLLMGFDLKKDIDVMLRAYNDSKGVTSAFNLNLLERINRDLGGNFNLNKFRHYASYDVFSGAMESYLVSMEKQEVIIREIGQSFSFEAWEPIHTEYSYKYLESDIEQLAENTGFRIVDQLYDEKHYFVDSIWQVEKIETTG